MAEEDDKSLKLRIPGYTVPDDRRFSGQEEFKVLKSRSYRLSSAERGEEAPTELADVAPDEVVELEFEDGTRIWTSSQRLVDEVAKLQRPRGAEDAIALPRDLELQGPSRGIVGKILIKTLRLFEIDVGELAATKLATLWEERTLGTKKESRGPGLYRIATGPDFTLQRLREDEPLEPVEQPFLIFLHGTASSTAGSFGELWEPERGAIREELLKPYLGRVLALEHETLTKSPIENAIKLAEHLPGAARLHLISHSRGGLVGELLCRAGMTNQRPPFDEDDFALFPEGDAPGHRASLRRLNDLLRDKRIAVDRFVRVACPARGTTLASERLDIYLSLILNLMEKLPFFKIATDILAELIMAIAQKRSDPLVLPGLAAQIPGSPLVRVLNRADRTVAGELGVIAGDIEGKSAISAISTLLTDPLYQGDHDLVVDTLAMLGGAERTGRAAFSFHHGANVSHFRYFKNEDSARKLHRSLTRKADEDDGFEPYSVRKLDEGAPPYRREDGPPRPIVFVLPGIMGSHLSVGEDRIWLDPRDLAFGGFGRLAIGEGAVQAGPPLWLAYSRLTRALSATHDVEPFPYDWRLSITVEADRLADRIRLKLEQAEQHGLPISLIGHSMGGLVARAMIAQHGELWERMGQHPDSRLIMLGTPNGGSHAMARALLGRDSLIKKLALLDFRLSKKELLGIVSRYPGILELLPEAGTLDLLDPAVWEQIAQVDGESGVDDWVRPTQASLTQAKAARSQLAAAIDSRRMRYVAGQAAATPVDLVIEEKPSRGRRLSFLATPEGDGRVPWATGQLAEVKTWYMPASHGDLANHEPAFAALTELLIKGSTDLLSTTAPVTRGAPERFEMPEERAPLYPSAEDLARAALGAGRPAPQAGKVYPRARVKICHGNLAHASHPVLVGHYAGDTIVSAEAYLNNRVLDGRLEARLTLGLYPGPPDSEEVFLNPSLRSGGAVVVGLGRVGDLSPGRLMRAVARGARKLALAVHECDASKGAGAETTGNLGLTALLVGSSAGGLPVDECVTQILRGVADANRALAESAAHSESWIREVEFMELYEDRAIQAAHALRRARQEQAVADFFEIDALPCVESCRGGRRRASLSEEDPWWQRLQITEDQRGQLSFNRLTDRARTEVELVKTQRELVDAFIDDATETTSTDDKVSVTLFEMLVPNDLKAQARDRRSLVLVLDESSARFPWELLRERRPVATAARSERPKPLSVEAGVIRQLGSEQYRRQPFMALGDAALVIGNPITKAFSSLPGAEVEAETVANRLEDKGYAVTLLLGDESKVKQSKLSDTRRAQAKSILHALHEKEYRILHLAGHGVYEYRLDDKAEHCNACGEETLFNRVTGMVLGDRQFLTSALVEQMQAVPHLVFINCCHLGKTEKDKQEWANKPSRLAANLATQLIRMGVRAVVAAGWAVDDRAAETFAQVFYERMLDGAAFGDAVTSARAKTYDAHAGVNSWGAYQCYGDPSFTLTKGEGGRRLAAEAHTILSRAECQVALENIAEEATTAEETKLEALRERLQELERALAPEWKRHAQLVAALGRAYGELGKFQQAIHWYREALSVEDASLPLRAVEQLCNLEARYAVKQSVQAHSTPEEALEQLGVASNRLEGLISHCGLTSERQGLRGSIAKRRAMLEPSLAGKRVALETMGKAYHGQQAAKTSKPSEVEPYTLFNALTADVLSSLIADKVVRPRGLDKKLKLVRDAARDRYAATRSFWDAVARPDCLLLQHLADRNLNEAAVERCAEAYLEPKKRAASPLEFQSVLDQLDFYVDVLKLAPTAEINADLANGVAALKAKLSA